MYKLIKKYIKLPNEIIYIMIEKKDKKVVYINKKNNKIKN